MNPRKNYIFSSLAFPATSPRCSAFCRLTCVDNTKIVLSWLAPLIFCPWKTGMYRVFIVHSAGMLEAHVIGTAQAQKHSIGLQSNLPILGQTYCTFLHLRDTASQIPSLFRVFCAVPAWQAWQLSAKSRLS